MDHPNAKLVRTVWEAVSASDVDTLRSVLADDLVWHASGRGPLAGNYRGRAAVLDHLATIGDAAERFDSRLDHVLVNDDLVAVLFHVAGRRQGRVLDTDFILLFRIAAGRIAEVWSVARDQYAVDEFWT